MMMMKNGEFQQQHKNKNKEESSAINVQEIEYAYLAALYHPIL